MMNPRDDGNAGPEQSTRQRILLLVILFITLVIAYLDRVNTSVLAADPAFLKDMGIEGNAKAIGLLMSIFLAFYAVANAVLGPLGDLLGPRKMILAAILIWGIAMCVGGLATSFSALLVARVVLGIGEGLHWPMQMKLVKNWFPPLERGKANSAWLLGLMVGPAVAMPFFTWIIGHIGWRPTYFVLAALALIPLVLIAFLTTDHPHENRWANRKEVDYIQSALRIEAMQETERGGNSTFQGYKLVLTNYRYWLLVVFYLASASVYWGTIAWLPSYFKVALGFSWQNMGYWSSLPYALGAISIVLFGYLTDRFKKKLLFAGLSLLIPAIFIYLSTVITHPAGAALCISFGISGVALGLPANWSILQSIVPGKALASGAGLLNGIAMAASTVAPMVIGYFIDLTGKFTAGLMYLVVLAVIGTIAVVGMKLGGVET
jgi:sugar phosphate permease